MKTNSGTTVGQAKYISSSSNPLVKVLRAVIESEARTAVTIFILMNDDDLLFYVPFNIM